MIVLGLILLILGLIFGSGVLELIGIILLALGAVFWATHTGPFNGRWY